MAGGALDSFLNVAIPLLLIVVVVGWLWVKLIEPKIWPAIKKMMESNQDSNKVKPIKEIVYGDNL